MDNAKVETKVKVATAASYFGGVGILAILQAVSADANLIAGLPDAVEVFAVPLLTSGITFVGGWLANHTYRPAPQTYRRGGPVPGSGGLTEV